MNISGVKNFKNFYSISAIKNQNPKKPLPPTNPIPSIKISQNYLIHPNLLFKGTPRKLPSLEAYTQCGIIQQYKYLKDGSYLDSHDDIYNPENKKIRENNIATLSRSTSFEEKKAFVEYYRELTGFPDLRLVSQKIENEFISTIKNAQNHFMTKEYSCISAGYDPTCSVGKKMAFPGSDLDKAYIILAGSNSQQEDEKIIADFSAFLWKNTDQRILSYNHDTSFPTIMTLRQIREKISIIENSTKSLELDHKLYSSLVENEYDNLEKAASYNILISDRFPRKSKYSNQALNKEDVKNFAYFIEALRDGKEIISTPESKNLKDELSESNFYKYSNVAQIRAMKNAILQGKEQKSKILKRQELEKKFDAMRVFEQFNLIIDIIKYSCELENGHIEYFRNDYDIKSKYKPLLGRLTKGDREEYFIPEFKKIPYGVNMQYSKNSSVNLYNGYSDEILWIDSSNSSDIERVLEEIDRIKTITQFKNIKKIQCPKPSNNISNFGAIGHYTENGIQIYETDAL